MEHKQISLKIKIREPDEENIRKTCLGTQYHWKIFNVCCLPRNSFVFLATLEEKEGRKKEKKKQTWGPTLF